VPVVRLVLDLDAAVEMFKKMNNLQAALQSRGVITSTPNAPAPAAAPAPTGKSKS